MSDTYLVQANAEVVTELRRRVLADDTDLPVITTAGLPSAGRVRLSRPDARDEESDQFEAIWYAGIGTTSPGVPALTGCTRGQNREQGGVAARRWPGGTIVELWPFDEQETVTTLPAATAAQVGRQVVIPGGGVVDDRPMQLVKNAGGNLEWRDIAPKAGVWPAQYVTSFGSAGTGNGQFNGDIRGIAVNPATGDVFVSSDNRVQQFSANGTYVGLFAASGSGTGQVNTPGGLDVRVDRGNAAFNDLWIADTGNSRAINKRIASGAVNYTLTGIDPPLDVEADLVSDIRRVSSVGAITLLEAYKTVRTNRSTQEVLLTKHNDPDFVYWRISGAGEGLNRLNAPYDVEVDIAKNILVTDTGNNRVSVFTYQGIFQGIFGSYGAGDGQFDRPTAICVTPDYLYVADSGNRRVQIWTNPAAIDSRYPAITGRYSGTWDPPSQNAGTQNTYVVTVEGAKMGDLCQCGHSGLRPSGAVRMDCDVTNVDEVTIRLFNHSGATQNWPNGVLNIVTLA